MFHYVYQLTNDNTKMKYIGVRSSDIDPMIDPYMSSSKIIKSLLREGQTFSKEILSTWQTRKEADDEESRLHHLYDVSHSNLFYNRANAPFIHGSGSILKGRTYEEIHGIERAKQLKRLKSEKTKGIKFTEEHKQKLRVNHADFSGANNTRAIGGKLMSIDDKVLFEFSTKKELIAWCKQHKIPSRPLIYEGLYYPPLTNRNRKFQSFFGIYVIINERKMSLVDMK